MTAKTTTSIKADILTNFPDNSTGLITPAITRSELNDIADSYLNISNTGSQDVTGPVNFIDTITVDGQKIFNGAYIALDASSTTTQNPSATDTPLKITFGAAQTNTDVSIDAAGKITYNTTGCYYAATYYRLGRSGSTAAAKLIIAYKVNGSWVGSASCSLIDTSDETVFLTFGGFYNMVAGDYVEVYIIRDSTGNNDGGLYAFTPALAGVPAIPSARTVISKMNSI